MVRHQLSEVRFVTNKTHTAASNVTVQAVENRILRNWNRNVTDVQSDSEDEEGDDGEGQPQEDIGVGDHDSVEDVWDLGGSGVGLSAWDQLGEEYEQDAAQISQWSVSSHEFYR